MFRKFRMRIGHWLIGNEDATAEPDPDYRYKNSSIKTRVSSSLDVNGMHFTVFPADGGKVVQFNMYDPVRDRSNTHLYIITDNDDFGEQISQIITKENLLQ